jgi:hypothetical protein
LRSVAQANDEGNGYERAVVEHEAFAHLLRQLDAPADEQIRHQRHLLRAVLEPPAFGGFVPDLARNSASPRPIPGRRRRRSKTGCS